MRPDAPGAPSAPILLPGNAALPGRCLSEANPGIDPVIVALVAAADALTARRAPSAGPAKPDVNAWRFSGRWWAGAAVSRRARPSPARRSAR